MPVAPGLGPHHPIWLYGSFGLGNLSEEQDDLSVGSSWFLLAVSCAFTTTTTVNRHHRHVDNGHDDDGEDSKVDEASRSFTVLEFRRPLEVAALPLVAFTFVVVLLWWRRWSPSLSR